MKSRACMLLALVATAACATPEDDETTGEAASAIVSPTTPIAPDLNQGSANQLGEVSGLAASPNYPGFVWMHRDGFAKDRPSREFVYAMKIVNRKLVPFAGASGAYPTRAFSFAPGIAIANDNWEDMAIGPNVLSTQGTSIYIGDIGNNGGGRNSYQVYQFAEPSPTGASSVVPSLQATWKFAYPASAKLANGEFPNCETMFLLDRNLYIVTKEASPRVYRFPSSFFDAPSALHTLVPVTSGAQTRIVGGAANPSYAAFSDDHQRFMIGGHERFFVYAVSDSRLTGDALVRAVLLTPGNPSDWSHDISSQAKLNAEGGTFEAGTQNVVLGTESKMVFHWPRSSIESP